MSQGRGGLRVLAVDYGDKRTGLAATDFTGTVPLPLAVLVENDRLKLVGKIKETVLERKTELVLVGMPLAPDGGLGARGKKTLEFALALKEALPNMEILGINERNTTNEAYRRLHSSGLTKRRSKPKEIDALAALIILETWLRGEPPIDLERAGLNE